MIDDILTEVKKLTDDPEKAQEALRGILDAIHYHMQDMRNDSNQMQTYGKMCDWRDRLAVQRKILVVDEDFSVFMG